MIRLGIDTIGEASLFLKVKRLLSEFMEAKCLEEELVGARGVAYSRFK